MLVLFDNPTVMSSGEAKSPAADKHFQPVLAAGPINSAAHNFCEGRRLPC